MRRDRIIRRIAVTAAGICVVPFLFLGTAAAAQGRDPNDAGVQVLTRGPIHEAFAEASMSGAQAGVLVTKAPYDPITELPPDQRPEGGNIAWIPGYWAWDDDWNDFIWVSGVWRDIPPGRQWVPGYWSPVGNGAQWIPGFWGGVKQTEVVYLPAPPEPLEVGPSSPSPGPRHQWNSGSWVWQQTRYDWQPGYWVQQQPDWVWSPAYYTWTPRGYIYVEGYWDRIIDHRGVMFAPVYYAQPVYRRPNYYYSPATEINLSVIVASLFIHSRSRHYYYGDYYDPRYQASGYRPWYTTHNNRYGRDPLYADYRARQLQQYPNWDAHIAEQYRYRRDHVYARPPQTMALQVNIINNQQAGVPEHFNIGRSFSDAVNSRQHPRRFTPVSTEERKQFETRGREVRNLQVERATMERATEPTARREQGDSHAQPVRMRLPASPVSAQSPDRVGRGSAPPPAPRAPKPVASEGRPENLQTERNEDRAPQRQARPGRGEASPAATHAKPTPKRAVPRPAPVPREVSQARPTRSQSPTPQAAEQAVPREVSQARPTRSQSPTPQAAERAVPQQAKPSATPPRRSQTQSNAEQAAPGRNAPKSVAKPPDSTAQSQESQAPQAEAAKREYKPTQSRGAQSSGNRRIGRR